MEKQVRDLHQFYLHHHRVGDQLGSSQLHEQSDEYHANDSHLLYLFDAMNALHFQLHQSLHGIQYEHGVLRLSAI
jgi:hypothetical protein